MEDNPVEAEGHLALAKQFDHKPRPISIPLITVSGRTGHPERDVLKLAFQARVGADEVVGRVPTTEGRAPWRVSRGRPEQARLDPDRV
jgi:hypothetical protein